MLSPKAYRAIATDSNFLVFESKEKTRIVVLLAFSHVGGNIVFIIGSSLYSLAIKTHISMPVFSINWGNNLLSLSFCSLLINSALSFSGRMSCALMFVTNNAINNINIFLIVW